MKSFDELSQDRSRLLSRVLTLYLLIMAWGVVVLLRLVYVQVLQGDKYRKEAEDQRAGFFELSAKRGDILDRNLEDLAISIEADSLWADPREVEDPAEASRLLSPILATPYNDLYSKLASERAFVFLDRRLLPRQSEQVRKLELAGIHFQKESRRFYPGGELAAHVLGFSGLDGEGLSGLEYLYNGDVKGEKKRVYIKVDARRKSYYRDGSLQKTQGSVLVLNIDRALQYMAEQALQKAAQTSRAINGSIILMNPVNGEVLAMASYPTFNPHRYNEYSPEFYRNRAVLEIYEPGSTFKVVTLASVLNEGLSDLSERIDCRVGTLQIAGKVYKEAVRSFGELSVAEVIAKSSNVGTIKLGLRLGQQRFFDYIRRFGFGEKSGLDLPGEQSGLLRPPPQWSRISIGALAIGQEIGVTPLQMVRAVSVLANGGNLVQPRLVRQILSPEGDLLREFPAESHRILSEETAAKMRRALAGVIESGTGGHASLNGYSSAGKTGTAQKFIDGSYSHTKYVASFLGFAPAENPALAAIIVINEPQGGYYGGHVAAPVFKEVMEQALMRLRVPQDRPVNLDMAKQPARPVQEPSQTASVSVNEDQLPHDELKRVLSLIGEGSEQETAQIITLETGRLELPDFSGMSLRQVVQQANDMGLALKVSGSGEAVGQRPRAGSRVGPGAVCEVFFSTRGTRTSATQNIVGGTPTGMPPGRNH